MKRTKHNLSHYVLSTFDMGQLIPVANIEVLPGDSIRMSTSCLLRVSPLMAPVMHPVTVRMHAWYVPYRVLDEEWEDFITGGPDGMGTGQPPPKLAIQSGQTKNLFDYFGIPTNTNSAELVTAYPFRAYNAIWNQRYRDQDLEPEIGENQFEVQNIAWEKDQATTARPWTQKGPDVTLPIGSTAPVVLTGDGIPSFDLAGSVRTMAGSSANTNVTWSGTPNTGAAKWSDPKLLADLASAVPPNVNDVRLAFALQRYQEARAQYGSRFTEYLRYLGVNSKDSRLQEPEYLGGGRSTISFSEVLRTGNESTATGPEGAIGEMKGHGISALRTRAFTRFFEEHGVLLMLASIRPKAIYTDGLHKSWSRMTKEDYWQKELEQVGQEAMANKEIYAAHTTPDGDWGFNDRYYSYRHHPSYVTGEFRDIMNDWHLARSFAAAPALNQSFVSCVPTKRVHAEQTQNSIWGMFSHRIVARRLVGKKTIGRIF